MPKIELSDILPEWLASMLVSMTSETDPIRIVSKLCAMHNAPLAITIASAIIMGNVSSEVRIQLVPSFSLPKACSVESVEKEKKRVYYIVVSYLDENGDEDTACLALEEEEDKNIVRPCSKREIEKMGKSLASSLGLAI